MTSQQLIHFKPVFLINHSLLTAQIVISVLGGIILGIGAFIFGALSHNTALIGVGCGVAFLGILTGCVFSGNSSYKAKIVLENIAANVEAKYEAKIDFTTGQFPEDFWSSLDKPMFYTFNTSEGSSLHQMYFLPTGEPMIVESAPTPSLKTSK